MTGLTHDERGYPSNDPAVHDALVRRLIDKIRLNAGEIIELEEEDVDDARVIVVSFGCTARSARQAVADARRDGVRCGLIRLKTVWPFPYRRLQEIINLGVVERFVVPEVNLGQLRREIERYTLLPIDGVNHAGGAMPTPEVILECIKR